MTHTLQSEVTSAILADRRRALAIVLTGTGVGAPCAKIVEAISAGTSAADFEAEITAGRIASA